MGVAGSGKTSLAAPLADALGARLVEADDLHPPANIAKMSAGEPLTDDDRQPWLEALAAELDRPPVVVTCSALRRSYRDVLRAAGDIVVVHLVIDEETAVRRLDDRSGHFMGPGMVASQFDTLEAPGKDETDVITVDGEAAVEQNVAAVLACVRGG